MKSVKELGFSGVEFYGRHFKSNFYRALLEETGLVCAGWHTGIDALEGEQFEATLELNLSVGNKYICVPWFNSDTVEGWKTFAERLNAAAERLRPYNIRTGFHCHAHEFAPVEGRLPWHIVAENTTPDVVLQLDTGNTLSGGADILATLKAYPGRNQSIHWKPYSKSAGFAVPVGSDDQDWQALLEWSKAEGRTEWIVLEYEQDDPLDVLKESMEFIRGL